MSDVDLLNEIGDDPGDVDSDYGRGYHAGWSRATERARAECDRLYEVATKRATDWPSPHLQHWQAKGVLMAVRFLRRVIDDEPASDAATYLADPAVDRQLDVASDARRDQHDEDGAR